MAAYCFGGNSAHQDKTRGLVRKYVFVISVNRPFNYNHINKCCAVSHLSETWWCECACLSGQKCTRKLCAHKVCAHTLHVCVCVCSTCMLSLVFFMCIILTFPLHRIACFIISSHILMSQFFKIGPISLSNLVNLAFLFPPPGFQLTLLPFDGSIEWG